MPLHHSHRRITPPKQTVISRVRKYLPTVLKNTNTIHVVAATLFTCLASMLTYPLQLGQLTPESATLYSVLSGLGINVASNFIDLPLQTLVGMLTGKQPIPSELIDQLNEALENGRLQHDVGVLLKKTDSLKYVIESCVHEANIELLKALKDDLLRHPYILNVNYTSLDQYIGEMSSAESLRSMGAQLDDFQKVLRSYRRSSRWETVEADQQRFSDKYQNEVEARLGRIIVTNNSLAELIESLQLDLENHSRESAKHYRSLTNSMRLTRAWVLIIVLLSLLLTNVMLNGFFQSQRLTLIGSSATAIPSIATATLIPSPVSVTVIAASSPTRSQVTGTFTHVPPTITPSPSPTSTRTPKPPPTREQRVFSVKANVYDSSRQNVVGFVSAGQRVYVIQTDACWMKVSTYAAGVSISGGWISLTELEEPTCLTPTP